MFVNWHNSTDVSLLLTGLSFPGPGSRKNENCERHFRNRWCHSGAGNFLLAAANLGNLELKFEIRYIFLIHYWVIILFGFCFSTKFLRSWITSADLWLFSVPENSHVMLCKDFDWLILVTWVQFWWFDMRSVRLSFHMVQHQCDPKSGKGLLLT